MLTPEQKALRSKGVGGSDCAAACGVSRYKSRYQLWAEKTGRIEPENIDELDHIRFGHAMEDVIALEFMRRNGVLLAMPGGYMRHPNNIYMIGHADRLLVGVEEGLEIKNVGYHASREWGEQGTTDIPAEYQMQCMHYMACSGYSRWHVAALIGGNEYRQYVIERDEEQIKLLEVLEAAFWKCVENDTAPPFDDVHDVDLAYPSSSGTFFSATDADILLVGQLQEAKERRKAVDDEIEKITASLKERLAENDGMLINDTKLCTWRTQARETVDLKRLETEQPELLKQYKRTTTTRSFRTY